MDALSSSVSTLRVSAHLHSSQQFKAPHTCQQFTHHVATKPNSISNRSATPKTLSFKNSNAPVFFSSQRLSLDSPPSTHRNAASGYAAALVDIARCNRSLETVYSDVQRLMKVFHHEQIQADLASPSISKEKKGQVVKEVAKKGRFNRFLVGLLKMLIEKDKSTMVGEVLMEFERIYDELSGTRVVFVSSGKKMKEEELLGIADTVQKLGGAMKVKNLFDAPSPVFPI